MPPDSSLRPFLPESLVARRLPSALPSVVVAPAGLLLADITGFTALTELLQRRGREGAEEVAAIVSRAFGPAIRAIALYRGSIDAFGGDALFATFADPGGAARARAAAEAIRAAFAARSRTGRPSAAGIRLGVGLAVHHGNVARLHVGDDDRRHYLVTGAPVQTLVRLGARAAGGLVLSRSVRGVAPAAHGQTARSGKAPAVCRLGAYVPPSLADALEGFEGEYRKVAVVFLETRGRSLPAIQRFFLVLSGTLERFEGLLLKTDLSATGTKWMCVFGVPRAHEDDPDRAARAALEIVSRVPRGIAVRGGLHAGVVANVIVGTARRKSFDVMGDAVNVAARALAACRWGEVVATEEARRLFTGITTSGRGRHAVKGKSEPVELHALISARGGGRTLRVSAPMIGRDTELAVIADALGRAKASVGSVIGIRGEPGLGKSRLKFEAARAARAMGLDVHEGRAIAFAGMAYWAISELVRQALRIPELAPPEEVRAHVDRCTALVPESADRRHLAEMLGASDGGSPLEHLRPQDVRRNTMVAVTRLFRAMAQERPRLIVLEDMHWADGASAEAAGWIARAVAETPLVLLLLYRPGFTPPDRTVELVLGDLDDDAVAKLLEAHLGVVPPSVARLVRERAGGNPFYVEEVVRHLDEVGILAMGDGGYRLTRDVRAEDLPGTLETLIAARLDRLATDVRKVAQHAAVIGRSFMLELLAHLPDIERNAAAAVEELQQRELVFEKEREPHLEYIFKHALTRDVAYGTILASRRRRLHGAVADALEALFGDDDAFAAMRAHHRELAGQATQARSCYLAAARRALRSYAHEEAERLYGGYFRLVERPTPETILVRNELGLKLLQVRGRVADAEREHRTALQEARAIGDLAGEGESLLNLGSASQTAGRQEESRELFLQSLALFRRRGPKRGEGVALNNLGTISRERGLPEQARELYEQALAVHREDGDLAREGLLLSNLATLHADGGKMDAAAALCHESLRIARKTGYKGQEATVLANLAELERRRGSMEDAQRYGRQALEIAREVGDRGKETTALLNLAVIDHDRGRRAEARTLYEAALRICEEMGFRGSQALLLGNLGNLEFEDGRGDDAVRLYLEALSILREVRHREPEGLVLANLASVLAVLGRLEEARERVSEALAIHRAIADVRNEGAALETLALLHLLLDGDAASALSDLERAEALMRGADAKLELAKLLCLRVHVGLAAEAPVADALSRARGLAAALGVEDGSFLGVALAKAERAATSRDAGRPLVCGHSPEDLPAGQLRWLFRNRAAAIPADVMARLGDDGTLR